MQWDSTSPNAGFSTGKSWQRVNESYPAINAASQLSSPTSVFHYWAHMLQLRKQNLDLLVYGDYTLVDDGSEDVFAYFRSYKGQKLLVVTNWRKENKLFDVPEGVKLKKGGKLVGNYEGDEINLKNGKVSLRPYEALAWFIERK
jgi:glycosidase